MRRRFAAIDVAVKNQDNREHDIFDSDDYLQDHGGMVATIRAADRARPQGVVRRLRRPGPAAGALAWPRRRPGWCAPGWSTRSGSTAMQRHGYKGAFEMAATVDYLFGYDATAARRRGLDVRAGDRGLRRRPRGAEVLRAVEPVGAARRSRERLLEADERGMWDASAERARRRCDRRVLEAEGWEESR